MTKEITDLRLRKAIVYKEMGRVRKSINEFLYSIRNAEPKITVLGSITTEVVPINVDTSESSLTEDSIVRAEKYVSGIQLDEIKALIKMLPVVKP